MLFDALRDLPLTIERLEAETLSHTISPEFTRKTTIVHLARGDEDGIGEDVTYSPNEHAADRFPQLDLAGDWTLESLSAHLDGIDLFPAGEPDQHAFRDYRRWAFESAALDLALRTAGCSLGEALGRAFRPLRFAASPRTTLVSDWIALYPALRFKLDASDDWTDELVAKLAGLGAVDVVDLKGQYSGTVVDRPADPELYLRVAEGFPDAWLEDPALTDETASVLRPYLDRVTWDAPIHSFADVEALAFPPRCLNVKPSRFGSLERLFEFYDRCAERKISLYGGGQWELGVGRGQIQLLASLFSFDGPNDVAPGGYNGVPAGGLERSPLDARPESRGFRRAPA